MAYFKSSYLLIVTSTILSTLVVSDVQPSNSQPAASAYLSLRAQTAACHDGSYYWHQ